VHEKELPENEERTEPLKHTCRNCGDLSECLYDTPDRKCRQWTRDEDVKPMPSRAAIVELARVVRHALNDSGIPGYVRAALEQVEKQLGIKPRKEFDKAWRRKFVAQLKGKRT
jgi:hypothetical protein